MQINSLCAVCDLMCLTTDTLHSLLETATNRSNRLKSKHQPLTSKVPHFLKEEVFLQNNAAQAHRVLPVLKPQQDRTLHPCHPLVASDQLCPAQLAANTSFPFLYHGAALVRAADQCQAWRHHSCTRLGHPSITEPPWGPCQLGILCSCPAPELH